MKRAGNLLHAVADMENLRCAFWTARKGKSHAANVEAYRADLDENLLRLQQQILRGKVDVGHYRRFLIRDPKERQICAPSFQEQVLHHALMCTCHPYFEKKQIFDSYACRKGKGTYAALERAKVYAKKYPYFLKLDVRKFFDSIHHDVLKQQLWKLIKDRAVWSIFEKIIDSYATNPAEEHNRGLPIGNLSSQYFANHYLCSLDHFIKEDLGIKGYVRYMDDMVLWSKDKEQLKRARAAVKDFVQRKLLCRLKPDLFSTSQGGLPFLGYRIFPHYVRLSSDSKRRFIKKLKRIEVNYHLGHWDEATCQRHVLPLLAYTQHANTRNWRHKYLKNNGTIP